MTRKHYQQNHRDRNVNELTEKKKKLPIKHNTLKVKRGFVPSKNTKSKKQKIITKTRRSPAKKRRLKKQHPSLKTPHHRGNLKDHL